MQLLLSPDHERHEDRLRGRLSLRRPSDRQHQRPERPGHEGHHDRARGGAEGRIWNETSGLLCRTRQGGALMVAPGEMIAHGELWTVKELFVYPTEFIYWSVRIVMYPFMTGVVAGAVVLSSLYHVFGIKQLKDIARFALGFSFALLFAAPMPIVLHLQFPFRGINVMMTPHFTSAIAAFGIVFFTYGAIVASELWFLYRKHFVAIALPLKEKQDKTFSEWLKFILFCTLTLGVYDVSEEALQRDEKAIKVLAGLGIPVACF